MAGDINILVVEDEESIRKFISINLKRDGFIAYEAKSGEEALKLMKGFTPDVIVLDIMLPGIDGYRVCSLIRQEHPGVVIIMLTAKSQDMDKIMGLELGADDYMVKPFNPLELSARIRAALRRTKGRNTEDVIESGRIRIDINAQRVYKDGIEIEFTPREFALLKVFAENPGKALSRDDLLDLAWGGDFFGDYKTVDVHIRRLREKVEDDPSNPRLLSTVWGFGYRYQEVK
jgi:Response regulators consisting of a CheY-like receiver domain and a winged-helix DNA-binding domain